MIPRRILLADQVAQLIRGEIARGVWRDWLPAGRVLSDHLRVNRRTLRRAIQALCAEGCLGVAARRGTKILQVPPADAAAPTRRSVALLVAEGTGGRPLVVDPVYGHLREYLHRGEITLTCHGGWPSGRRISPEALDRLVGRHPADCWIVRAERPEIHAWFRSRRIPALAWGRGGEGTLPSVSISLPLLLRYAAGVLLGRGHRRLALFTERVAGGAAGPAETFLRAVGDSPHAEARAVVFTYEANAASIERALGKCLALRERPTAFAVTRTCAGVALLGLLARQGVRVPEEVSLIVCDDDPLCPYLVPAPCRFAYSAEQFARRLHALTLSLLHGEPVLEYRHEIMPEFVPGGSVGRPPA